MVSLGRGEGGTRGREFGGMILAEKGMGKPQSLSAGRGRRGGCATGLESLYGAGQGICQNRWEGWPDCVWGESLFCRERE